MKNANSRFVRVLALVLVVLMVVPAALVGCGSKKANDAAISEALAAAQAAKEAAEQAKKDAEAAIKEAEEKAQAALDAAKEAQDKLNALTTTGPVTEAPVVGNKKEVSDYAYKVLNENTLDFLKTYIMYAYGAKEDAVKDFDFDDEKNILNNDEYTRDDVVAMIELYDRTVVAIMQADTIDYINQLVANFVAEIEAIPTYVERVVAAYEAIDFDSDYDVIDVVYAFNLIAKADYENGLSTDPMLKDDFDSLEQYGEDAINIVEDIKTEYDRYTGVSGLVDEDDVLYNDMFVAAGNVAVKVYELFTGEESHDLTGDEKWDASKLPYVKDIDKNVAAVKKAYTTWYNTYFAKDEALAAHFEAFRQAFVGEAFILDEEGDFLWALVEASEERAADLVAAVQEYKDTLKSLVSDVASIKTIKYWLQADKVAAAEAALDAWKLEYGFKTADGEDDDNVKAIMDDVKAGSYESYNDNADAINYFVYLANNASAVNAEGFVKAYEEDLLDDDTIMFDFVKYASAVTSVLDWYYGKRDSDGKWVEGAKGAFKDIVAKNVKGFESLKKEDFNVAELAKPENPYHDNLERIYKDVFGFVITDADFEDMKGAYNTLAAVKKQADEINKTMEKILDNGVSGKNYNEFAGIAGKDYLEYVDADEDEKLSILYGDNKIAKLFIKSEPDPKDETNTIYTFVYGDKNFESMIDWDKLDAIWDAYTGGLADVIEQAEKIVLEYIAWKNGPAATEDGIKYEGVLFGDLEPLYIDAFSYSTVAEIVALKDKLDIINVMDGDVPVEVTLEGEDEEEVKVSLEQVVAMCTEMRDHFYNQIFEKIQAVVWGKVDGTGVNNFATFNAKYTEWMQETGRHEPDAKEYKEFGTVAEGYVDSVLNSFKFKSAKAYKVGSTTYSYENAVKSVNPYPFMKANANDNFESFDSAGYKKAIEDKLAAYYPTWLAEYIKDVKNASSYTTIINNISTIALNHGLWKVSGDFEIGGDKYSYTYGSVNGIEAVFYLEDRWGEEVEKTAGEYVVEYVDSEENTYNVTVKAVVSDGTVQIDLIVGAEIDKNLYPTHYDFLGLDEDEFIFDVREQAETIANAFAKIGNVKKPGGTTNYNSVTADTLNAIFAGEAQNDFWVEYNSYGAMMFTKNSNGNWSRYGLDYLANLLGVEEPNYDENTKTDNLGLDDATKATIELLSKEAYDRALILDASNASIEDIETVFKLYEKEVKATLKDAGYTLVQPVVD